MGGRNYLIKFERRDLGLKNTKNSKSGMAREMGD